MNVPATALAILSVIAGCGGEGSGGGETEGTGTDGSEASGGTGAGPGSTATDPTASDTDDPSMSTTDAESSGGQDTDSDGEPLCDAVGFGDVESWSLPDYGQLDLANPDDRFSNLGGGRDCAEKGERMSFTLLDMTGDGGPDFVVTDACDANGVGAERWLVHAGQDGGFGEAQTWSLPDYGQLDLANPDDLFSSASGGRDCAEEGERMNFALLDLTGDGLLDIVVTDACDANGVGAERWLVHAGEDGGFGEAQTWSLPDYGQLDLANPDDLFSSLGGGRDCAAEGERMSFALLELTGDGVLDIVVTDACDTNGVGAERWLVHAGEDGGFGEAQTWSLPDYGQLDLANPDDLFSSAGGGRDCTAEGERMDFALLDLSGDGRLDVVVTDACDANGVGAERWLVHAGEDGGFGEAQTWSLPDYGQLDLANPNDLFSNTGGGRDCTEEGERMSFALLDLTGDGRPDVVVTDACDANGVGAERWLVHAGEDGGFGEAQTWPLPDYAQLSLANPDDPFSSTGGGRDCAEKGERMDFALLDLSADGRSDLVLTDACDPNGVGAERWLLHAAVCE